jgi:PAS domain S-box-containing protein
MEHDHDHSSPDPKVGIVLVSSKHRLLSVNSHFCEMMGRTARELVGLRFEEVTHPDDADLDSQLAARVFTGELDCYRIRKRFLAKNGITMLGDLTATAVRDQNDRILFGVAIVKPVLNAADAALQVARDEEDELARRIRDAMLNS